MNWSVETNIAKFINESEGALLEYEADNNMLLQFLSRAVQNPKPTSAGFKDGEGTYAFLSEGSLVFNKTPQKAVSSLVQVLKEFLGANVLKMTMGPEDQAREFARAWAQQDKSIRIQQEFPMTLQKLKKVNPVERPAGQFRRAWIEEADLLAKWFEEFVIDTGVPGPPGVSAKDLALQMIHNKQLFVWGNNRPASMVAVGGSTPKGIRVHSVYTPLEKRGKGFAKATVAALSELQLSQGKEFLVLYNDALKPENAKLYQTIGYEPIASHYSYFFSVK